MRYKYKIFPLLILLIALIGFWYFFLHSKDKPIFKISPVLVMTTKAKLMNIPVTAKANGVIVAPNKVELKSQTNGIIDEINFYGGEQIEKNKILLSLISTKQQADLNVSLAAYTQDKLQFDRYKTLYNNSKAVTLADLDSMKSLYLQSKAKYESAKYALSLTKIHAPFSGIVSVTNLAIGSYVSEGDALVQIVDRLNLIVQYSLPERLAGKIRVGQIVRFYSDSYKNKVLSATVTYISPTVNADNLTFTIRAKYQNKNDYLSPGMSVQVQQILKPKNLTIAVPESAVYTTSGGFSVYIVKESKAKQVAVQTGELHKGYITIKSGVSIGDNVISSSDGVIGDGTLVKVEK
jgi:membrane fusion protein (multidrug efflux system)